MRLIFLTSFLTAALVSPGFCTIPVIDYSAIAHSIYAHAQDYLKEIESTLNQYTEIANQNTQIVNQVTQIAHQVTQLERLGDPKFYVNMLHLDQFTATASNLSQGVGQTIGQFRQTADGVMALGYTANGLYSNLTNAVDRFGNRVQYTADSFRKFGAVNQMYESYDQSLRTYNGEMSSLEQQLASEMRQLNSDSTQMGSEKHAAMVNALSAQMNALGHRTNLTGQRVAVQHWMNQNDAARTQEAQRQQLIQERQADLQHQAANLSTFIDADPGTGN